MAQTVTLPVGVVRNPLSLPMRCIRHGEPEVGRERVTFITGTSLGMHATMLAAGLAGLVVTPGVRNPVRAPAWPFCPRCRRDHTRRLAVGRGVGVGVPVLLVLLAVVTGGAVPPVVVLLGSLAGILAGGTVGALGTWVGLTGGEVTKDGAEVVFQQAAAAFVTALG